MSWPAPLSPTASSPPGGAPSSSPTRRAMSNIPATWRRARRPPDLAIILIDARKGVLTQTRRHSFICSLLGIRHVVLAINKIDLVGLRSGGLRAHRQRLSGIRGARSASLRSRPIPMSARYGDNVVQRSEHMPWYHGPTLLDHLETVDVESAARSQAVPLPGAVGQPPQSRFPRLLRHRRVGDVAPGDPSSSPRRARRPRVARIVTFDGDLDEAGAGDAVTLTLTDEIDISRGDLLASPKARRKSPTNSPPMSSGCRPTPLLPGRAYLMRIGTQLRPGQGHGAEAQGRRQHPRATWPASTLALNEIGFCNLSTAHAGRLRPL